MGSSESSQDRYVRDTLMPQVRQLQANLPNLADYYKQNRQDVLGSYTPFRQATYTSVSPDAINNFYRIASQGLSQQQNRDTSFAASQAGALAASRGLANPSGFVSQQTQNVRQSYIPQFTNLEGAQAQALGELAKFNAQGQNQFNLYNNQGLNQNARDYTNLIAALGQQGGQALQGDFANKAQIAQLYNVMSQYYDPYSSKDKNTSFAGNILGQGIGGFLGGLAAK